MKTHSLIISPLEVRAALRRELGLVVRPVKGLGDVAFSSVRLSSFNSIWGPDAWIFETPMDKGVTGFEAISRGLQCTLGVPGDRLVCREPFYIQDAHGQHRTDGLRWGSWSGLPTTISPDGKRIAYYKEGFDRCAPCWRSPATMPAWASRITLEVVGVRVIRLNNVSNQDILLAGVRSESCNICHHIGGSGCGQCMIPARPFIDAWNRRYGRRYPWESNPWVWAAKVKSAQGAAA